MRVWVSVDMQTFPGHGSGGAVSRPARRSGEEVLEVFQIWYQSILNLKTGQWLRFQKDIVQIDIIWRTVYICYMNLYQ